MIIEVLILVLLWVFDATIRQYLSAIIKLISDEPLNSLQRPVSFKPTSKLDCQSSLPPEIFEFKARENVPVEQNGVSPILKRKAIQKAVCITVDGTESEEDVKKWQFVCSVCNKAFDSIYSCEKHILENEHTSLSSESTDSQNFEVLRWQLEMLRNMNGEVDIETNEIDVSNSSGLHDRDPNYDLRMNKDFLPVYFGKWSKVICELRHKFSEVHKQGPYIHNSTNSELTNNYFKPETIPHIQTYPKVVIVKEETVNLPKREVDLKVKSSNTESEVDAIFEEVLERSNVYKEVLVDRKEYQSSKGSTTTEISELTTPSDVDKHSTEDNITKKDGLRLSSSTADSNGCQTEKSKVYVDFGTRLLYCESCLTSFNSIEQALSHFKTDGDSDKSADQYAWDEYDMVNQMNREKSISSNNDGIPEQSENEEVPLDNNTQTSNEKTSSSDENSDEVEKPEKPNSNNNSENELTLFISEKYEFEDHHEQSSLGSYSENIPLFVGYASGKKKLKRKKKKKAWKLLKRSLMYTITFLF